MTAKRQGRGRVARAGMAGGTRAHPESLSGATLRVRELMTPAEQVATLAPETSLREAAELLSALREDGAAIISGERVVGVLSASDLLDVAAAEPWGEAMRETAPPRAVRDDWDDENEPPAAFFLELWQESGGDLEESGAEFQLAANDFDSHTVAEVMSRRLFTVRAGATAREAAILMQERGVHRLLVMDGERLQGLITTRNLARAVADGRLHAG